MSGLRSLSLSSLPVEVLHQIARSGLPISGLSHLIRASRFFYKVFCDEIYRLAAASPISHVYLYRCATVSLFDDNTNALQLFVANCADKAVLSATLNNSELKVFKLQYSHLEDPKSEDSKVQCASALQAVAAIGNEPMVRLLLDHGADVNAKGGIYSGAIHAAAYKDQETVVRLLLDYGADINALGPVGTALMFAAASGSEAMVRLLLDHGADVNVNDQEGTALEIAAWKGHEALVRILLDHGANVNAYRL